MTIAVSTGTGRIPMQKGAEWDATHPVCRVNNAFGPDGMSMLMTSSPVSDGVAACGPAHIEFIGCQYPEYSQSVGHSAE